MDIERLRKSIGQFWQTTLKGADEELPGTKSTTTKTADGVEDGSSEWGMIDDGSCAEQETYSYNSDEFETQRDQYSVGWLCALPIEQTAAKAMLDEEHPELPNPPNDNNAYTLGSVGKHNVVIVCLPKGTIGTVAAAQTAANMITTFPKLKFLLMVGVGGGVPSGFEFDDDEGTDIRLGDIVVVVDGLDECQEADGCRSSCISTLLNFKSALEPKVNLFVTSRSLPDIDEAFRFSSTLEINATDSDVRKFVEAHAPQVLSRIIETDGLEEAVTKTVVDAVDGM
ncbi:hypothetical protein CkaCkLH20_06644 [Colletotrichum karsti]|uniref:Nephrocystin 3-like N-terminal domain-containing protein n=1 Tax=Colletotrichum karsti TaxID=1095194 RepID=A0A9P6I2E2_9PEZI|nr:uncharacterized protein CkaCkLH20_06644 [Colletotrichum karsti]KAF9875712.1 hypothetical protein CkaCkLH20_06644 [Colletotrichum karsti]